MKIYKTVVAISGDPKYQGKVFAMPTIEYEGKMWLVPDWIVHREKGYMRPVRIILLDTLPHQKSGGPDRDYILNSPLPKAVYDGQTPPQSEVQYVVIEAPDIKVRDPNALH